MDPSDQLVTIGRFSSAVEASLARNRLVAAGIDALIAGEVTSSALGLYQGLSTIDLQVREKDVLLATGLLEGMEPAGPEDTDAIQAPGSMIAANTNLTEEEEEESEPPESLREMSAKRALVAAVLAVFIWPLHLYVFWYGLFVWALQAYVCWLLFQVYCSAEQLRPRYYRQALIGGLIIAPLVLISLYLIRLIMWGR